MVRCSRADGLFIGVCQVVPVSSKALFLSVATLPVSCLARSVLPTLGFLGGFDLPEYCLFLEKELISRKDGKTPFAYIVKLCIRVRGTGFRPALSFVLDFPGTLALVDIL